MTTQNGNQRHLGFVPFILIAPFVLLMTEGANYLTWGVHLYAMDVAFLIAGMLIAFASFLFALISKKSQPTVLIGLLTWSGLSFIYDVYLIFRVHNYGVGYSNSVSIVTGIPISGFGIFSGYNSHSFIEYFTSTIQTLFTIALPIVGILLASRERAILNGSELSPPQTPKLIEQEHVMSQNNQHQSGTNGMAITGFVLSFFCWPLGIIFSAIGLNQTSKNPNQGGRGLAIAGLVLSLIAVVGTIIWIALIAGNSGN